MLTIGDRFPTFSAKAVVSNERGKEFVQLSGEDATALGFNAHGGVGCISVTANVAPRLCAEFQDATLAGDYAKALAYQDKLMPLHKAIFMEPGVCGAKYALNRIRGITSEPEVGQIYKGKVVKIMEFGAFVNFFGPKDGLVHISQLTRGRPQTVGEVVKEGQEVYVKLLGFDDRGKVRLSMRIVDQATGQELPPEPPREGGEGGEGEGGERRERRDRGERRGGGGRDRERRPPRDFD